MTGRAFPSGLILEILARQGQVHPAAMGAVFETLRETGFRYYDHAHLPPDTDDVAMLLRLLPYAPQYRPLLDEPLQAIAARVEAEGAVPVWLPGAQAENVALWGQYCVSVEANFLLGLLALDEPTYQPLLDAAAAGWLKRVAARGLSDNRHYVPLYSLWLGWQVVNQLPASAGRGEAMRRLMARFQREASRPRPTAQEAALLLLSGLAAGEAVREAWVTRLCKTQRYDGAWLAEPLYGTPTRGELATWYASNSVTTALAFDALRSGAGHLRPNYD